MGLQYLPPVVGWDCVSDILEPPVHFLALRGELLATGRAASFEAALSRRVTYPYANELHKVFVADVSDYRNDILPRRLFGFLGSFVWNIAVLPGLPRLDISSLR